MSKAAPAATERRVLLRRVSPRYVAIELRTAQDVTFADGTTARAIPGEWIVTQGTQVHALLSAKDFPGSYEVVIEGGLTITPAERTALEAVVGVGACRSGPALVRATSHLADISIGDVRIPFTPGQLAELQYRAEKRGQTVEQAIRAVIDRIESELFHGGRT